jgi:hypothetical protein
MALVQICVTTAVTLALEQLPSAFTTPQLDPVTDREAYAIYAVLVPAAWAPSKDPLALQRETETSLRCTLAPSGPDPEWDVVANNFKQQNDHPRVLMPMLSIESPYRLVPRAEIEADDARLALRYPGLWQGRPGSMEFVAVSAVASIPPGPKRWCTCGCEIAAAFGGWSCATANGFLPHGAPVDGQRNRPDVRRVGVGLTARSATVGSSNVEER